MTEADDIDRATTLAQQLTDGYVGAARKLSAPQQTQNPDGSWPITECVDCGVDIPEQRLAMARIRCVDCQTAVEKHARHVR